MKQSHDSCDDYNWPVTANATIGGKNKHVYRTLNLHQATDRTAFSQQMLESTKTESGHFKDTRHAYWPLVVL